MALRSTDSAYVKSSWDFEELINLYVAEFELLLYCLDILLLGLCVKVSLDFVGTPHCVIFDVMRDADGARPLS